MLKRVLLPTLAVSAVPVLLWSCFGDHGAGPRGEGAPHHAITRMSGSALAPGKAAAARAPACGKRPCLTPANVEGRVYSGNLMVGSDGNGSGVGGSPGVPIRVVDGRDTAHPGPRAGRGGTARFNLGLSTDLSGRYACCSGSYPEDGVAVVHRLEFLFDYLDVTFQVPAGAGPRVAGKTYTIRTVYVDTGTAGDLAAGDSLIFKGDKLLRGPGQTLFHWCGESACGQAARPEKPLRAAWHSDASLMGYPHYVTVGIELKTPMAFTRAEAEAGNWRFTLDFDLDGAAQFQVAGWSAIKTEADLVAAFDLLGQHGGPGGINVDVDLAKTRLE